MAVQLNFFHEKSVEEILREEYLQLKLSTDKVRRSLFAKNAELASKYVDLSERLEIIERNICKGK